MKRKPLPNVRIYPVLGEYIYIILMAKLIITQGHKKIVVYKNGQIYHGKHFGSLREDL